MRTTSDRMWKRSVLAGGLAVTVAMLSAASFVSAGDASPPAAGPNLNSPGPPRRLASQHLVNPVRVHERVICGGVPEGEAAFRELRSLGVKTLISVDGATPDLAAAKEHGIRYIHLPHGYDGISTRRIRELAKAVQELEGVIFIHCHHGRHRSPAAASVACVAAGVLSPERGADVLRLAGTGAHYLGLHQVVSEVKPIPLAELSALQVEFRSVAPVAPIAAAMATLERTHDRIQQLSADGWMTKSGRPKDDPVHQSLLLREHFVELLRRPEVQAQPRQYQLWLQESADLAERMHSELAAWSAQETAPGPPASLTSAVSRIAKKCAACHAAFRD